MDSMQRNVSDATKVPRPGDDAPHLDALLDVLPVGVYIVDKDSRIRMMNGTAARLLRVDAAKMVGRPCKEAMCCSFCGPKCAAHDARDEGVTQRDFPSPSSQVFAPGLQVRMRRPPAMGAIGSIVILKPGLTTLPSGLRAPAAEVKLENGETIIAPLVNLEVVG